MKKTLFFSFLILIYLLPLIFAQVNYQGVSFTKNIEYQDNVLCPANTNRCIDEDTLRFCNDDGTDYEDKDCQKGEFCVVQENGEGSCKIEDNNDVNYN